MDMKSSSPKDIKQGALFLWLWRAYLRRHMWVLAVIVVLMMIEGSMVGGLAWMMQPLFDGVFVGGSKSQLWLVGGIVLGLFLIRGVLSVVHRVLMTKIAKQSVADLQNDLLRHLLQLDLSFFSRYAPGYLMERVNGDVQAVAGIWALLVRGAARDFTGRHGARRTPRSTMPAGRDRPTGTSMRKTIEFLLHDWLDIGSLAGRPRFADHSRATFDSVLDTCERIAKEKQAQADQKMTEAQKNLSEAERQKQEAERQRIDAEGKATANRILSASLTDKILQEKGRTRRTSSCC